MSKDKSIYVVMRRSGAVMRFSSGLGGSGSESEGPYLHVLGVIATEMQSAGSTFDAPQKLFLNGRLVVADGLADLAWRFRQDEVDAREAALRAVRNMHMPDWLPEGEVNPAIIRPALIAGLSAKEPPHDHRTRDGRASGADIVRATWRRSGCLGRGGA